MCHCPLNVRESRTITPRPGTVGVRTVVLTICNCDRRPCPVNDCQAYVGPLNGNRCGNGHKS